MEGTLENAHTPHEWSRPDGSIRLRTCRVLPGSVMSLYQHAGRVCRMPFYAHRVI